MKIVDEFLTNPEAIVDALKDVEHFPYHHWWGLGRNLGKYYGVRSDNLLSTFPEIVESIEKECDCDLLALFSHKHEKSIREPRLHTDSGNSNGVIYLSGNDGTYVENYGHIPFKFNRLIEYDGGSLEHSPSGFSQDRHVFTFHGVRR